VYSMGIQAWSGICAIVALTGLSSRTVTETSAPPRIAALIVGCPKNAESARINGLSGALEARKREEKLRRSA